MEHDELRRKMVAEQIRTTTSRRKGVKDEAVLTALENVPRESFVPPELRDKAFDDRPLPIGFDQTISQPYIVALMSELLEIQKNEKVLEVGTGSGYQTAVLSELTPHVFSVEIRPELHERAERALRSTGYANVKLRLGDGALGWPEEAPFDAIIVTAGAPDLPPALWDQLKPGGRIVIPVKQVAGPHEQLLQIRKRADGSREVHYVLPVIFVPMAR